MGTKAYNKACDVCGSRDNVVVYEDGGEHCFTPGCTHHVRSTDADVGAGGHGIPKKAKALIPPGEAKALKARAITAETCRKFRYTVGTFRGKPVQIAPYFDESGTLVAQKLRFADKSFTIRGDISKARMFGAQLWSEGGKKIVITEGEIDALSVSQVQRNSWPVISLVNGAASAADCIKRDLQFLETFDEVILMFDQDEPGEAAVKSVVNLFSPGKVKIARLPRKDPNEMLVAGETSALVSAIWQAAEYRPGGIVNAAETWEHVKEDTQPGLSFPWPCLYGKTYGQHETRLYTWTAGTGIGKSAIVAEVAYDLLMKHKARVGYIALEDGQRNSMLRFLGIHLSKPLHIPGTAVTAAEKRAAFEALTSTKRLWLYDHFGSLNSDDLISAVRYMVKALDCKWIILDHLSIVVSGMNQNEDERRAIDKIMTTLRSLVEETGCGMHLVCHLKRRDGKPHEEGAPVTLGDLRSSQSIAQLSDFVISAERNQQAEEDEERNQTVLRVLKNRPFGLTGPTGKIAYSPETGRLTEVIEDKLEEDPEFNENAWGEEAGHGF